ncbi:hypothetical protein ACWGJ2_35810 [Streptomyces sp. NPDC054796]
MPEVHAPPADGSTAPLSAPPLSGHRGGGPVRLEEPEQPLSGPDRRATGLPGPAAVGRGPVPTRSVGVVALGARIRLVPREHRDPRLRGLR